MNRNQIILFLLLVPLLNINAQKSNFTFNSGASAGYISSGHIPFWLRSDQFGSIPLDNASLSFIGSIKKDYNSDKKKFFDWGVAAEGRANVGNKSNFILIEGYGKIRSGIFEIRAGRSKEIMGLCDTVLTSGAWAVSGTALGIPKVQISIPEFYILPIFGHLFAFKGNYVHGWIGETPQTRQDSVLHIRTYLHQKSLYGRFGKPEWKWKLYGGFNHQVLWGNGKDYWGDIFTLSPIETYLYVITGRGWNNSRMGNSLGSIDLGFEYKFRNVRLLAYRQNLYDAGALYYLANIADGLNGLSLTNLHNPHVGFQWKKLLVEVLYTKNQAGEPWSKYTPSGDEDYFNHYQYIQGWSYQGIGIGNPFITPRTYTREGLPSDPSQYFFNNRVVAFHLGFEGSVQKWDYILKTSYSLNYGTYATSEEGSSMGTIRYPPQYGIFPETKQFSAYLDASRKLKNGLILGFTGAFDVGELLYDSFGMMVRVGRVF